MQTKRTPVKRIQIAFSALCTVALVNACAPANSPSPTGPEATPTPSSAPTNAPSAEPTAPTPTATPTAAPSEAPSPSATPQPTPTPEVPSPTPEPTPTPATSGTINVQVFDDNTSPVTVAQVTASNISGGESYNGTAERQGSTYTLSNVPLNQTLELKVTAPGYTTRTRLVSLSSLEPEITLEFKDSFSISSRPEVVSVEPEGSITSAYQTLTIRFSEEMDRRSVERSLGLQLESSSTFLTGTPAPGAVSLRGNEEDTVFDIRHFNVVWDGDDMLKLTPKWGWPRTRNSNYRLILTYRRAGDSLGGGVKDQDQTAARDIILSNSSSDGGNRRVEDGPFRSGNINKASWPLRISYSPDPIEFTTLTADNNGDNDTITLTFTDNLSYTLPNGATVIGGSDGRASAAPAGQAAVSSQAAVNNYRLTCNGELRVWPAGSAAILFSSDQVRLQSNGTNLFDSGEQCQLNLSGAQDPRGATIRDPDASFSVP